MDRFNFSDYPNTNFNETNLDFLLEETSKNSANIAKNTADIEELKAGGTIIDYEDLQNLPKINGVTLMGDKSLEDIGAASADELSDLKSALYGESTVYKLTNTSNVSRQFEHEFIAGHVYTVTNNTSAAISFQTRLTETGETVEAPFGTAMLLSGATRSFTCGISAHWFNSWCPQTGNITITLIGVIDRLGDTDSALEISSVLENNCGDILLLRNWRNRIYYTGQGIFGDVANRIGLQDTFISKQRFKVAAKDGYRIAVTSFSASTPSAEVETGFTGWVEQAIINPDTYYIMTCKKADESAIYPADFNINPYIIVTDYDLGYEEGARDYAVSGFSKERKLVTQIGTFPAGFQSFCIYNGDYYVIQEGHIYVFDGTTFAQKNHVELSFGHGNSFQLGSSNIAYISGWNDATVYSLNLDTLTIVTNYTIPVSSGETATVAVDDVNMLMYIFKTSNYAAVAYYDFLVYDYSNSQIISSKKITKPFSDMQSCQFVNGLIVALNGMGTTTRPNGFRIYNTLGDILCEYFLNTISAEPEGVFFDSSTNKLLISDVNRRLFLVE